MASAPSWQVREASDADAEALALIGAATFLETFAGILPGPAIVTHCARQHANETYRKYLTAGARAWLAEAQPGGAPIGYAMLTPPDLPGMRDGDGELKRIYALSRFHGSGLGASLMQAVINAGTPVFDRLLLGVYKYNARAIAFYTRNGFDQIAERQFDVGGTLCEDIVLAKPLVS